MIKKGMWLRHERFMDVCIQVTKVFEWPGGYKIKGEWWNLGQTKEFPINMPVKLTVSRSEALKWRWSYDINELKSGRNNEISSYRKE